MVLPDRFKSISALESHPLDRKSYESLFTAESKDHPLDLWSSGRQSSVPTAGVDDSSGALSWKRESGAMGCQPPVESQRIPPESDGDDKAPSSGSLLSHLLRPGASFKHPHTHTYTPPGGGGGCDSRLGAPVLRQAGNPQHNAGVLLLPFRANAVGCSNRNRVFLFLSFFLPRTLHFDTSKCH